MVEDDGELNQLSVAKDVNVCEVLTSGYTELEDLFKFGNFTKCPMKKVHVILSYLKVGKM